MPALGISGVKPIGSDQHDHSIRGTKILLNDITEIGPARDTVDITEHTLIAEVGGQGIGQAARRPLCVIPAIAYEYALFGRLPKKQCSPVQIDLPSRHVLCLHPSGHSGIR